MLTILSAMASLVSFRFRSRVSLDLEVLHRAAGVRYHAIAEEGVPFKDIAGVIGRRLNVPVVAKSREEAADYFTWFALFAGMDVPASNERTRAQLGWEPKQPGIIADIDQPSYFEA
ncbi:MAG: hypothetical protein WCA59_09915 [Candidatus Binataceae bacterium]